MKAKKFALRSIGALLKNLLCIVCVLALAACQPVTPPEEITTPEEPPVQVASKTVWDYTIDELVDYLIARGHIEADDYTQLTPIATYSRIYSNIEILWWDVDHLEQGTTAYETWNELAKNDYYYFMLLGTIYAPKVNGPFAIRARDSYPGDAEKLYEDFLAFPSGYVPGAGTIRPIDYTKDDSVYDSYDRLALSYPNLSYSYELDPIELPEAYCMRDDYILYTQAQGSQELCWSFAASTSLSTTIMKATGEYLDFSEAWISLALRHAVEEKTLPNFTNNMSSSHTYGDTGWFLGFDLVANRCGVVLEQDYSYGDSFLTCNENAEEYYNVYRQYASYDLMNEVVAVRFDDYALRSKKETILNSMKSFLLKDGSIAAQTYTGGFATTTYNGENILYQSPSSSSTDGSHIVSLIGWDDSFTLTENGKTYTGAWIVLNSWDNASGRDGIFYILYDDATYLNDTYFWGYKYLGNPHTDDLYFSDAIVESSASCTTDKTGAYYGDFSAATAETKQKNIFFGTREVSLTYRYEISSGAAVDGVEVYLDGNCVTQDFSVALDPSAKTISIFSSEAQPGAYKVAIAYSASGVTRNYFNSFYLCDGTELTSFNLITKESDNSIVNNGYYNLYYRYGNAVEEIVYFTSKSSGEIRYYIPLATYHRIVSVVSESSGVKIDADLAHSYVYLSLDYEVSTESVYPVTFLTSDGVEKTVRICVIHAEAGETFAVNVSYQLNGGINNSSNPAKLLLTEDRLLTAPERAGYLFDGWYCDAEFSVKLSKDGYLLSIADLAIPTEATNGFQNSFNTYYEKSVHIFLYAKWIEVKN